MRSDLYVAVEQSSREAAIPAICEYPLTEIVPRLCTEINQT